MRKTFVLVLLLLSVCFGAFADDSVANGSVANDTVADDSLLLADEPIVYGEESFIQRIETKTGGEREPIGVVLSGGSARAFAHIGVLQYLEEQGIYPDYIVSNSMGSIIGLLYGAGMSPAQILELVTSVDFGELFDFSIPVNTGLLDVSKFKSLVGEYVGEDLRLEDLAIPVMVVCEDMVTKRQVLITEGDFLDVLAASFALPVYFGSVEYGDHMLIDGGIANLVPVGDAYRYSDNVIVSTTFYSGKDLNLKNPLTGLNVSIDIGKRRQGVVELKEHPNAVWVRCNVEDFSFMDFKEGSSLARIGYESCQEKGDEIAELASLYIGDGTSLANADFKKALERKRISFASRMPKLKRAYALYNRTKTVGSSSNLGFSFESYANDVYSLRDDSVLGLGYSFSSGNLDVGVAAGASFKLQSYGYDAYEDGLSCYTHALPTVDVCVDYYLWDHVKASARAAVGVSSKGSGSGVAFHFDALESLQYRSGSFSIGKIPGSFSFKATQTFEVLFPGDGASKVYFDSSSPLLGGSVGLSYDSSVFSGDIGFGVQHLGWIGSDFSRAFGAASMDLGLRPVDVLGIGLGVSSRFSFDGNGNVPVFAGDGFLGLDPVIKSQGSPNALKDNGQQYMIALDLSLDFMVQTNRIGIAELILLSRTSVGAFCNLLWYDGAVPAVQAGARVSTNIDFLGLKNIPLCLDVAYDFSIKKVVWNLSLKSPF